MLAEGLVGGREVEHVVDDLEAHPEVVPEARERVERGLVDPADHPADAARGGEQRRGLALDRRRVGLLGAAGVEEVLQLEHLAPAELADRRGEQRGDVGAERRGERRCPGQQVVASEDRHDVAPPSVHRGHAATGLGLVDHVVVVERPEVNELAGHAAGHGRGGGRLRPLGRIGRAEGQGGPEPLAPGAHQVLGDLAEEPILAVDRPAQLALDALHVGGEGRELQGGQADHRCHGTHRGRPRQNPGQGGCGRAPDDDEGNSPRRVPGRMRERCREPGGTLVRTPYQP